MESGGGTGGASERARGGQWTTVNTRSAPARQIRLHRLETILRPRLSIVVCDRTLSDTKPSSSDSPPNSPPPHRRCRRSQRLIYARHALNAAISLANRKHDRPTFSQLKPTVGAGCTNRSSLRRYRLVDFPALSKPAIGTTDRFDNWSVANMFTRIGEDGG